jgi:hypothetical protein
MSALAPNLWGNISGRCFRPDLESTDIKTMDRIVVGGAAGNREIPQEFGRFVARVRRDGLHVFLRDGRLEFVTGELIGEEYEKSELFLKVEENA